MSAISSTQAGQGLAQYLQSIVASAASATNTSKATPSATGAAGASPTSSTSSTSSTGKTKGHHHPGGSGGFEKLLATVTTALQSAQSSGSTADPNQTIENALEKIFKNGIDGNTAGTTTASATNTTSGADDTAASATDADTAKQTFLNTLKSFGVTPEQFQQDLAIAFKQANGGQLNPSAAFASFAPGSLVDTLA